MIILSKTTERKKTPSEKLWDTIDMIRHRDGLRQKDLAQTIGVSSNTVSLDSNCPERIPMGRMWRYLEAVGINEDDVLACIAKYLTS